MRKIYLLLLIVVFALFGCSESKHDGTVVQIETNFGKIKLKLYDSTPKHKENFLKLIKEGFYTDLLFHRVIKDFMMQGGDPVSKNAPPGISLGNGGPGYTIPAEIGAKHFKGALAAARLGDQVNPKKESSGSQFYIVQGKPFGRNDIAAMTAGKKVTYSEEDYKKYETIGGAPFLDGDYTVFGEVVEGLQVVDLICNQQCDPNARPLQDIKMKIKIL